MTTLCVFRTIALALCSTILLGGDVNAQSPSEGQPRHAATTVFGDTGLWFISTGEVLPAGAWSASGYRVNFDREEGFSDVSHLLGTVAIGVRDRVEVFGAWRFDTRIRRAVSPLFSEAPNTAGSVYRDYPLLAERWSGDRVGDVIIGTKFNVASERRGQPAAFALRAALQAGTGNTPNAGTGKMSGYLDAIVSKELSPQIELASFGGVMIRQNRSDMRLPESLRWGIGAGFPSRSFLRIHTELHGEALFTDEIQVANPVRGVDGTMSAATNSQTSPVDLNVGATWQHKRGYFASAGMSWALRHADRRSLARQATDGAGDALGLQLRLGYHPGVRRYVSPAPPPPPPPLLANLRPTVRAQCAPCTVHVGGQVALTAEAEDADGDVLTFLWSAPVGALADARARETNWTAPDQEGPVPVTVSVSDGKGGAASDMVTIQVARPPRREIVFEDVHFDFDRYTLRPEAARLLDEVARELRNQAQVRVDIEGHTCNIGTAEYNLALGERRATAVRNYLASLGVDAGRLSTVSYGEERPRHDNAREETRRLNRRAALIVRIK